MSAIKNGAYDDLSFGMQLSSNKKLEIREMKTTLTAICVLVAIFLRNSKEMFFIDVIGMGSSFYDRSESKDFYESSGLVLKCFVLFLFILVGKMILNLI